MGKQSHGEPIFATTAVATTARASVAGSTNKRHYITDVSGGAEEGTATLQVLKGSTVVWEVITPAAGAYEHAFKQPIIGVASGSVTVLVTGTGRVQANLAGFTLE